LSVAEFKEIVRQVEAEEEEDIPFSERSVGGKIMYILEFPFAMAGFLTIPPVEEEKLESPLVCFYPFSTCLAFVYLNGCKKFF
jgi:hypothetical protein